MKTISFAFLLIITALHIRGQNYLIRFTGNGASSTVDSVKVENLSQCTSLTLAGTDTLRLGASVGIIENGNLQEKSVTVYPNPAPGSCSLVIETTSGSNMSTGLYDISGKSVLERNEFLEKGKTVFHLSGLHCGVYLVRVESEHYLYTVKLVCNSAADASPSIAKAIPANGSGQSHVLPGGPEAGDSRGKEAGSCGSIKSVITMQYNAGDTLKLTGKSGIYRTVSMLIPDSSQTLNFQFTGCSDADSNHYAVVQIGSLLWMQENLRTTKYRDGSDIPNVTDSASWGNLSTGAYCDYHNLPSEGAYYGHLYNFYAVDDSLGICPSGWHVPSNGEWNIMEKFLDNTVDTTALGGTGTVIGRILKEGCDTRWEYLDSTYGFNSAGFTTLCTNYRTATGAWSQAPDNNHDDSFWTATSYDSGSAWFRSLRWCYSNIFTFFPMKRGGYTVRCIKD